MVINFDYGPKLEFAENQLTESNERNSNNDSDSNDSNDSSGLDSDLTVYNRKLSARSDTTESEKAFSSATDSSKYTFSAHSLGSHWRRVTDGEKTTSSSATESTISSDIAQEDAQNLCAVQEKNLTEVLKAVRAKSANYATVLYDLNKKFRTMTNEADEIWQMAYEKQNELENDQDSFKSDVVKDVENMMDFSRECIEVIADKDKVDHFLSRAESIMRQTTNAAMTLAINTKKVENIRKMLDFTAFEQGPLTVFEHEDYRLHQVLATIPNWIKMLPFNGNEKVELERLLLKAQQNPQFSEKEKIEQVFGKMGDIMKRWSKKNGSESDESMSWHSISSNLTSSSFEITRDSMYSNMDHRSQLRSTHANFDKNDSDAFKSSSFALTDDSNLNDLDQLLSNARIRTAVEGPYNCYEASTWSTASNFTDWTEVTNGLDSIQSLREPMSLSSYEMKSSAEPSLSETGDKFNFEEAVIRTALSHDDFVGTNPPRSHNPLQPDEKLDTFEDSTHSGVSSYSIASLSIPEMIDEALHTAIDVVEKESHDLYNSLRDSATKCGVAMNNLLGNTSSSESKSSEISTAKPHQE